MECLKDLGEVKTGSTVPSVELTFDHKAMSCLVSNGEPNTEAFGNYVAYVIR